MYSSFMNELLKVISADQCYCMHLSVKPKLRLCFYVDSLRELLPDGADEPEGSCYTIVAHCLRHQSKMCMAQLIVASLYPAEKSVPFSACPLFDFRIHNALPV